MELNEKLVKEIPSKSKTAESLFTLWATRERNARDGKSTVEETRRQLKREGYIVSTDELLPIFRDLHRAGAGVLRGRTFTWSVGLKELAKDALEYGGNVADKKVYVQHKPEPSSAFQAYKVVVAYLGGDRKAKIEVPADLTRHESRFLESLVAGNA